jgi:curved DNA-binding protein CbpA
MKFDSPIYDRIRVKPAEDRRRKRAATDCEWPGCRMPGTHRAPKGRGQEGKYWRYCLDHVRAYNQSYNYFAGMSDDAVAAFQRDAVTGHRPTWRMGYNGGRRGGGANEDFGGFAWTDPFGLFEEPGQASRREPPGEERRPIRNAERKALDTLGLEISAKASEIKRRFKQLVKRHHPDANGGDRSTEERLKEVIQAYNYLKAAGFC